MQICELYASRANPLFHSLKLLFVFVYKVHRLPWQVLHFPVAWVVESTCQNFSWPKPQLRGVGALLSSPRSSEISEDCLIQWTSKWGFMQCEGKFSLPLELETITWIRGGVSLQMQTYFQLLHVSVHETRARKTGCPCRLGKGPHLPFSCCVKIVYHN